MTTIAIVTTLKLTTLSNGNAQEDLGQRLTPILMSRNCERTGRYYLASNVNHFQYDIQGV